MMDHCQRILVPEKFTTGPDGKDFRTVNKNFRDSKDNAAKAKNYGKKRRKNLAKIQLQSNY